MEGEEARPGKDSVDIPLPSEIRAIVGELRGESRPVLLLAMFGGLRASELRGLPREGAVDFKTSKAKVFQRADRHKAVGKPKSEAGEREVPLPPIVINALREWVVARASKSAFMFPAGDGGPLAHRTIADAFMAAQVRAKVVKAEPGPDGKPLAKYTGLHALRHFYASWCINRRADGGLELPPKMVQERLGHASFKLTMDVYGHLFPSDDDGAEMTAATAFLVG
jgi:integrase